MITRDTASNAREIVLESEFRPEYVQRLMEIQKEPIMRVGSTSDLRKRYGLK